ncbi:hypothetical protein FB382_001916 [Nocardioides ginsengisegetis]|uniref:Uncharacterized protein n=1 Tax=Nocardioides ginsengisegetis TaxID=661491 RepID=A0A7W3P9F3_9ACTN|nr:hypothetical protein [Nocardioides ginsengisegetis]MBA8803625.1 hypothetical protein [Nocardioides ginsengisegetis]
MTGTVRPGVAGVLVTLGLTLLSACGGDSEGAADPGPACMQSLSPASVPSDGTFPTDWPFPPGTVVTATEEVPGGGLAVTAQVGSDFEEVLPFMQHDLEDAGFVATQGEAEHDDAEATWSGNGYAGTWAIRSSETCSGTTLLQVAAAKQ